MGTLRRGLVWFLLRPLDHLPPGEVENCSDELKSSLLKPAWFTLLAIPRTEKRSSALKEL